MVRDTDHQVADWPAELPQTIGPVVGSWVELHPNNVRVLSKWSERMKSPAPSTVPIFRSESLSALLPNNGDLAEHHQGGDIGTEHTPQSGPFKRFDDSDFYHHILQAFIDHRSVGSTNLSVTPKVRVKRSRGESRDRKASKGRKVKYQVHEKLAHFMVPLNEREGTWHEQQVDELFMSLPH